MKWLHAGLIGIFALLTIVGCGKPVKNPGGFTHSGGWAETLTVDPAARIGKDFWITYTVSGAAGEIISTTLQFDLPPTMILVSGPLTYENLNFQQNAGYSARIWVRIEKLEAPILIHAQANGIFRNNSGAAFAGSSRYLIPVDGTIIADTDLPQSKDDRSIFPGSPPTTPRIPRLPRQPDAPPQDILEYPLPTLKPFR
ncbi:MAG: hypothetical protein H0T53_06965 [Herpetosiphonaceae bacterium]|nr:hypothetical protein [Herpetosiphonaceae bacterium]